MTAFSCGSSVVHSWDNGDTAITPWWMSCDRCWKLLLGGFPSLVAGPGISKVKSVLSARPIRSLTLFFLLWKYCLICAPPSAPWCPHTHPHPAPPSSLSKTHLLCEMSHSMSISFNESSELFTGKYSNTSVPRSHRSQPIRQPLRKTHTGPISSAYEPLRIISSDSSQPGAGAGAGAGAVTDLCTAAFVSLSGHNNT